MVSDNIPIKGFVVLQRITKTDPSSGGLVAIFVPVRVTTSIPDADAFILQQAKQNVVLAKRDFRRVETTIDLDKRIVSGIVAETGNSLHAFSGSLTPTGAIVMGKPRTDN